VYVFGDSLSDTAATPPEDESYAEERWSNGPLWVEYLSWQFGIDYDPSRNFASAGSRCADALAQTMSFTPESDLTNALCVVWAGGNDFQETFTTNFFNDAVWKRQLSESVLQLSNAVDRLYASGARFILVPNAPDMSRIPAVQSQPTPVRTYLRKRVQFFNHRLNIALKRAQATRPGLRVYRCNVFGQGNALLNRPARQGFTHTRIDALSDPALLDKSLDGPGAEYVFWDPIHPTTKTHALVATWFHTATTSAKK
jgi:phospholipase/lecithinase/hemolysin